MTPVDLKVSYIAPDFVIGTTNDAMGGHSEQLRESEGNPPFYLDVDDIMQGIREAESLKFENHDNFINSSLGPEVFTLELT